MEGKLGYRLRERTTGKSQNGFIPNQDITDNAFKAQMLLDLLDAKNQEGFILSIDQEKAFDR